MFALPRLSLSSAALAILLAPNHAFGQELKEFVSAEGRYQIHLPGTPTAKKQVVNGIEMFAQIVEPGEGLTYAISYFDLPPKLALSLETAAQAYAKARKATIVTDKKLTLEDEYPGRDAVMRLDAKRCSRLRLYIIGARYYQIIVEGTQEQVTSATADRVLDSFQRVKK